MSGHPFFSALDDFEAALLLTTLTMGGSDKIALFNDVCEPTRTRITERGEALVAIPTEARVALMVHELKERLTPSDASGLEQVDYTWLLEAMRGESVRVVGLVLLGLPAAMTRVLVDRLPQALRETLPPKAQLRRVEPTVALLVRQRIARRLAPMPPAPSREAQWGLRELTLLSRRELRVVCRDLGLIELGQAFAAVGRMALVELCRRLPKDYAAELIDAVQVAAKMAAPNKSDVQRFLARVVVNFDDTEELFQKAGLWRLSRALLGQPPADNRAIAQRFPRQAGRLLLEYLERIREEAAPDSAQVATFADEALVRVVVLSRIHQIDAAFGEAKVSYSNSAAAQTALLLATEMAKQSPRRDPGDGPADDDAEGS